MPTYDPEDVAAEFRRHAASLGPARIAAALVLPFPPSGGARYMDIDTAVDWTCEAGAASHERRFPLVKARGSLGRTAWSPRMAVRQQDGRNGEARSKSRLATDKESASCKQRT